MDLTDLCDDIYMFGYPEHTHEDLNAYWDLHRVQSISQKKNYLIG